MRIIFNNGHRYGWYKSNCTRYHTFNTCESMYSMNFWVADWCSQDYISLNITLQDVRRVIIVVHCDSKQDKVALLHIGYHTCGFLVVTSVWVSRTKESENHIATRESILSIFYCKHWVLLDIPGKFSEDCHLEQEDKYPHLIFVFVNYFHPYVAATPSV